MLFPPSELLNAEQAFAFVTDIKNGTKRLMIMDGLNLQQPLMHITGDLYHRTCSYLDQTNTHTHAYHQHVMTIRRENKYRLEYILANGTRRYNEQMYNLLVEFLLMSLQTEVIAQDYLRRIRKEEFEDLVATVPDCHIQ